MRRQRHNLSMLTAFTSSTLNPTNTRRPYRTNSSGLAQLWKSTFFFRGRHSTLWLFPNLKILSPLFRACRHSPPWSHFLSGVLFWHLWMIHPPRTRMNTCVNVAPNAKRRVAPCAKRKVLNLTKLKGKIYKTKSLGNYITTRNWFYGEVMRLHNSVSGQKLPFKIVNINVSAV